MSPAKSARGLVHSKTLRDDLHVFELRQVWDCGSHRETTPYVVAYRFVTFSSPLYVVAYNRSAVAVEEFEGFGCGDGFGDGLEGSEVSVFGSEGAEGEGGVEVLECVAVLGVELASEFVEGEA